MNSRTWIVVTMFLATTLALAGVVTTARGADGEQGQSGSATMPVSANVIRKCTVTAQPLSFGSYDPVQANASAPLDAETTVVVACTRGTMVSVGMGTGANATGQSRRMSGGDTGFLSYEVYKDASRADVWGGTGGGLLSGGVAPSRDPRQFTVYGRIAGAQDVVEGAYQDTILVTVEF